LILTFVNSYLTSHFTNLIRYLRIHIFQPRLMKNNKHLIPKRQNVFMTALYYLRIFDLSLTFPFLIPRCWFHLVMVSI